MRLEGKVAVVTGAGSGIGAAAAKRFAEEGAGVVCADIVGDAAESTADGIRRSGGHSRAVRVDVSESDSVRALLEDTVAFGGRLDAFYANAGILGHHSATETTEDEWSRVMAVNLMGVWLSARYAVPKMLESGGGSIINQASITGMIGTERSAAYSASKGGVIALTRQMAVDYGSAGIRVNALAPGAIRTPLVENMIADRAAAGEDPAAIERQLLARYLLPRLGEPRDCAEAALFLASDESGWITGAVLPIDAGITVSAPEHRQLHPLP